MHKPASLSPEEWHAWFNTQAGWTQPTRQWLYKRAGLGSAQTILEVGCGSGIIAEELARVGSAAVTGLDINPAMLGFANRQESSVTYVQGDAHALPFCASSFDAVVCHYLLLWLADPALGIREMARVIRPEGCILACAEPDYGGRIDHPPELAQLGRRQTEALRRQGAEPEIGRRLGELFAAAGLQTTVGTMAGQWQVPGQPDADFDAEWAMRERDLAGSLLPGILRQMRQFDRRVLQEGQRVLFVPTFYALGRKTS